MAEARQHILECMAAGDPPNVALANLFLVANSERDARRALAEMASEENASSTARRYAAAMWQFWECNRDAYGVVTAIAALADRKAEAGSWRGVFDEAVNSAPEASVALYSLGSSELLEKATEELVRLIDSWGLLRHGYSILDLGCGTGRIARSIASRVTLVAAADISEQMIRCARQATRDCANVIAVNADAGTLPFKGQALDVILAIDSFPYVVESGLSRNCFAGCVRALKAGGYLLIMNYSYRGDVALDRSELDGMASEYRMEIRRNGTSDLSLWDGKAFLLRKLDGSCP